MHNPTIESPHECQVIDLGKLVKDQAARIAALERAGERLECAADSAADSCEKWDLHFTAGDLREAVKAFHAVLMSDQPINQPSSGQTNPFTNLPELKPTTTQLAPAPRHE